MKKALILGAGHFGSRALKALNNRFKPITIVDRDAAALKKLAGAGVITVCAEANAALLADTPPEDYDYLVPAVPVHVAFDWLVTKLRREGMAPQPVDMPAGLAVPNPYYQNGALYASMAAHLCPEECPEPDGYCYVTGEERPQPLYSLLANLQVPGFAVYVVQSVQLAPGVGGITSESFLKLYDEVRKNEENAVIATSCSCHAVLHAFTL